MGIEIIDVPQNSPEWLACRAGIPTASEFHKVLSIRKEAKDKVTRRKYMLKLAGEIITGETVEGYSNIHMERGHLLEEEARNLYAFMTDAEPQRVGFVRNGKKGCSPDSLLGGAGVLEIKTKQPDILIDCLLKDEFPSEHRCQCQGALWVCERDWIDIACYWPKLPLFVKRSFRDEAFIRDLSQAVDDFNSELAEMVERVRRYGMQERKAA
jgi:hypothetical protein